MPTVTRKKTASLLSLIILVTLAAASISAKEIVIDDSWDVVLIAGSRIGFAHTEVLLREDEGNRRYVTRIETEMEMVRGSAAARVSMSNEVEESEQGQILGFRLKMATSGEPVEMRGHLQDGKLVIAQTALGRAREFEVELPGETIGPYAATRLMKEKGFAPGTQYTIQTFEGETTKALSIDVKVLGDETVDVFGREMRLHKLEAKQNILPGVTIHEWCDDEGNVIKTEIEQMAIVTLRTTKEEALKASSAPKIDLLTRLAAPCDIVIPHPYLTKTATFRVISAKDSPALELPSDSIQKAKPLADGASIVIASRAFDASGARTLPIESAELAEYLAPSAYIQSDDEMIVKLAKDAIGDERNSYKAAISLCRWVSDNISLKDFSVGFASAREVADHLQGDCTEHSVLLAALLRAVGIPSRCVVGLIYADGSFYYHLWNEAFISEWMPLDASLNRGGTDWDSVHIKILETSLNSPMPMLDLASLLPTMGNIKVEVVSLDFDGRTLDVKDPGRLSFEMGNRYENLLYSFVIEKPGKALFEVPSSALRSTVILTVQAPAYAAAELTVEAVPVGFGFDLGDFVRARAASGKGLTKIHHLKVNGRPAVRFVQTEDSKESLRLLIHDRDTLITIKAIGQKKWRKKLFNKAAGSFRFTDAK